MKKYNLDNLDSSLCVLFVEKTALLVSKIKRT